MSERESFLRAIIDAPADDLPRLVFADWLDEQGDGERAEFIRVQCELGAGHSSSAAQAHMMRGAYEKLGDLSLLLQSECRLLKNQAAEMLDRFAHPHIVGREVANWKFSRGFISEIRCTLAQFVGETCPNSVHHPAQRDRSLGRLCRMCDGTGRTPGCAAAIFREHPVERVVLTADALVKDRSRSPAWRR